MFLESDNFIIDKLKIKDKDNLSRVEAMGKDDLRI